MNDFLNRALLGWRDKKMPAQSYNILTAIDEVSETFKAFRPLYDDLSEFAHPNWSGVHGAYARINTKDISIDLGSEFTELPVPVGLGALVGSLNAFRYYHNKLAKLVDPFGKICDAEITKTGA
jgi:hypothetical protein